jgi:Zn ribbon nucleic-acid-binding protein
MQKVKKEKIVAQYCPHCEDTKMVQLESGDIEVFECENCKFKIKKDNKK